VDCQYHNNIDLVILPMQRILKKMSHDAVHFRNVEKCMEFLFTSCDQSKLKHKLKSRNLRHKINNTIMKLKKLNALHFAITVANTAQAMSDDSELSN